MGRILYNAKIYTLNPQQPLISAIFIGEGGRILAAGNDAEVLAAARPGDVQENMTGQTIWPGLTDSHLHLDYYSASLAQVDCETATRAACIERVAQRAANLPPEKWVCGHGWNQNVWPEGFGNASLLDSVTPHNPAYLTAKSLHAAWANSLALKMAGISDATPDPQGGHIDRDAQGKPTGILFESAMELVEDIIPAHTVEDTRQAILQAQKNLWSLGITGVHDFDRQHCFQALQILDQSGDLKLRVLKSIPVEALDQAIEVGLRRGFGSDRLRIGSVKCFSDGALGPQTAAMLQPYENSHETGMLLLDAEQIIEIGRKASQHGLSLAIHAIGDRANHEVLQAYEALRQFERDNHLPLQPHRIEHVQILHRDDVQRLAQLGIVASVQPIHATSDMDIADRYWGARSAYAYAYQSLLSHGTTMIFGSDAPVESPNPFGGLHAAVTRQRTSGAPEHGWYPEQRISLQQALAAFTSLPASVAGWSDRIGSLHSGMYADLIVLDQDPFDLPPQELAAITPSATMFNGEWVAGK
ncbi:MAG TPA: amidohydrolase [Bellilinea sp.]|jgi:predicted amidohydrolase YtcJ|nr:amidohydrolase [Bellilinea sp.]